MLDTCTAFPRILQTLRDLQTLPLVALAAAALLVTDRAAAFAPQQNPPWPASYAMNQSTISMACNQSGWYDFGLGAWV